MNQIQSTGPGSFERARLVLQIMIFCQDPKIHHLAPFSGHPWRDVSEGLYSSDGNLWVEHISLAKVPHGNPYQRIVVDLRLKGACLYFRHADLPVGEEAQNYAV